MDIYIHSGSYPRNFVPSFTHMHIYNCSAFEKDYNSSVSKSSNSGDTLRNYLIIIYIYGYIDN